MSKLRPTHRRSACADRTQFSMPVVRFGAYGSKSTRPFNPAHCKPANKHRARSARVAVTTNNWQAPPPPTVSAEVRDAIPAPPTSNRRPLWRRLAKVALVLILALGFVSLLLFVGAAIFGTPPEPKVTDERNWGANIGNEKFGLGFGYNRKYEGPASKNPLPKGDRYATPPPKK